jgi:hypothetical protein
LFSTRGLKVPDRPEWLHEVKYDGYRLRVERNGDEIYDKKTLFVEWTGIATFSCYWR